MPSFPSVEVGEELVPMIKYIINIDIFYISIAYLLNKFKLTKQLNNINIFSSENLCLFFLKKILYCKNERSILQFVVGANLNKLI
jgi:hypothetical protein